MVTKVVEVRTLKKGKFVVIDGEPCKIVGIQTSKPGKHGAKKARIEGIGVLDGQKRSLVKPVESKIDIPLIERKAAQILAIMGNTIQLMDMETYETFELRKPGPGDIEGTIVEGAEIEYLEAMGRQKIVRVRSG